MTDNQSDTAIIILAAGASTRLGTPKQLVKTGDKYLLEKMVETALETPFRPVVVILGAYFEKIKKSIDYLPIHIVENKKWTNGMGSSILYGIKYLENNSPKTNGTLLMLSDQIYVTSHILNKLEKKAKEKNKPIAVAEYENTFGPPAYFNKILFSDLKKLDGKGGAKPIFEKYRNGLAVINFPMGKHDLDTPADIARLNDL